MIDGIDGLQYLRAKQKGAGTSGFSMLAQENPCLSNVRATGEGPLFFIRAWKDETKVSGEDLCRSLRSRLQSHNMESGH